MQQIGGALRRHEQLTSKGHGREDVLEFEGFLTRRLLGVKWEVIVLSNKLWAVHEIGVEQNMQTRQTSIVDSSAEWSSAENAGSFLNMMLKREERGQK